MRRSGRSTDGRRGCGSTTSLQPNHNPNNVLTATTSNPHEKLSRFLSYTKKGGSFRQHRQKDNNRLLSKSRSSSPACDIGQSLFFYKCIISIHIFFD